MSYYKVNAKVAEYLNLTAERNMTKDGNYILWVADINRFGSLVNISGILEDIGGVALNSADVVKELRGEMSTKLPEPKDARFIIKSATALNGNGNSSEQIVDAATEETATEVDDVNTENAEVGESSGNTETHQTEEPTQATSEEVTKENTKEG